MPRENRLAVLRQERGLSQKALAQSLHPPVAVETISRWENRKHRIPDAYEDELAAMFGSPVVLHPKDDR